MCTDQKRIRAQRPTAQNSNCPDDAWRDAVDNALVSVGLGGLGPDDLASSAVAKLLRWAQACALDPKLSSEASKQIRDRKRDPGDPVAFMQIGVAGSVYEGAMVPCTRLPKRWNPRSWRYEPLTWARGRRDKYHVDEQLKLPDLAGALVDDRDDKGANSSIGS
jgi:hypothetical protein